MWKKTNNKQIKGFNLENKMGLQKLTCSICDKKIKFFKTSKKQIFIRLNLIKQNMLTYSIKCRTKTENVNSKIFKIKKC